MSVHVFGSVDPTAPPPPREFWEKNFKKKKKFGEKN